MRLVGDLHTYVWSGRDNNCNSYAFAKALEDERHVLVDPGYVVTAALGEPGLERLRDEMKADGLDPERIGMVLLTHFHPDHCESANLMRRDSGARVGIHEIEADIYAQLGGEVDVRLGEGRLDLGPSSALELEVLHTPGHSPGHVCLYWPKEKVLIAGDLVFYRSTGRVDLPGGDLRALVRSIERLAELDVEYLLCGHPYGHPGVIEGRDAVGENFEFLRRHVLP
jgi:glyoxylase-like metal-dependent hydrolase (beta-lactamase superfamily II)